MGQVRLVHDGGGGGGGGGNTSSSRINGDNNDNILTHAEIYHRFGITVKDLKMFGILSKSINNENI